MFIVMGLMRALHKLNAGRQYKIVGGGENFGCGALFWEQCALFPCFLWQAGLPPAFYGGIGRSGPLYGTARTPIRCPCTVSCIIGRRIWTPPGLRYIIIYAGMMHRQHQPSLYRNLQFHFRQNPADGLKRVQLHRLLHYWGLPLYGACRAFVIVEVILAR